MTLKQQQTEYSFELYQILDSTFDYDVRLEKLYELNKTYESVYGINLVDPKYLLSKDHNSSSYSDSSYYEDSGC